MAKCWFSSSRRSSSIPTSNAALFNPASIFFSQELESINKKLPGFFPLQLKLFRLFRSDGLCPRLIPVALEMVTAFAKLPSSVEGVERAGEEGDEGGIAGTVFPVVEDDRTLSDADPFAVGRIFISLEEESRGGKPFEGEDGIAVGGPLEGIDGRVPDEGLLGIVAGGGFEGRLGDGCWLMNLGRLATLGCN